MWIGVSNSWKFNVRSLAMARKFLRKAHRAVRNVLRNPAVEAALVLGAGIASGATSSFSHPPIWLVGGSIAFTVIGGMLCFLGLTRQGHLRQAVVGFAVLGLQLFMATNQCCAPAF